MATLNDFLADRAAAGARYAAAITELRDSMIDLRAIDLALQNNRLKHREEVRSFSGVPQIIGAEFEHPVYAPRASYQTSISMAVEAAAAAKLATFSGS